ALPILFEKGVRYHEEFRVTDRRRPQKTPVRMVASARYAEGRTETSAANIDDRPARTEQPLAVRFDHVQPLAVRICGAERVALDVVARSAGPRPLAEESPCASPLAQRAALRRRRR